MRKKKENHTSVDTLLLQDLLANHGPPGNKEQVVILLGILLLVVMNVV